jgi:hypothetical protein
LFIGLIAKGYTPRDAFLPGAVTLMNDDIGTVGGKRRRASGDLSPCVQDRHSRFVDEGLWVLI